MKKIKFILLLFISISLFSCQKEKQIKYVFLFIGDGMGVNHTIMTDAYLKSQNRQGLSFLEFPNIDLTVTSCADSGKITDSGAGGTAIACGRKTQFHAIGMDRNSGEKFPSIAEIAKNNKWKVGIITSVGLNHATPAVFYAHQPQRNYYYKIAREMWQSDFDFFGGGGMISDKHENTDANLFDSLENAGYTVIYRKENFDKIFENKPQKVYLLDTLSLEGSAIYSQIDKKSRVSLADFTQKAIDFLYNSRGFFLMVEGGKIDWASHDNDFATMAEETADFDKAIRVALDFYEKHPDETVIIVTADHETGGLSYGYRDTHYDTYFSKMSAQHASEYLLNTVCKGMTLTETDSVLQMYFDCKLLDTAVATNPHDFIDKNINALQDSAAIGWTTGSHTGTMIATYAIGVNADEFKGIKDNTFIFDFLRRNTNLNFNLN